MENVILVVLLILALCLISVVLLQRSEGGGLGMGGGDGGGGGGIMSGRAAASALTKLTWFFGIAFMIASLSLTVLSAQKSGVASVIDRVGDAPVADVPAAIDLLPPSASDAPLSVPRAE